MEPSLLEAYDLGSITYFDAVNIERAAALRVVYYNKI
jgi:hypothetical protein